MQQLAAFIDLNTYKITNAILADIYTYSKNYDESIFYFYNYSALLHKSLNLNGKTLPTLSGRRKVQVDIRIICDVIEYACLKNGGNILLLCGTIDSTPLFNKLNNLGCKSTFATMQKVNIGATNYLMLSRQLDTQINMVAHKDFISPKTLVTMTAIADAPPTQTDDYDSQLQELNLLINKLKF